MLDLEHRCVGMDAPEMTEFPSSGLPQETRELPTWAAWYVQRATHSLSHLCGVRCDSLL